MDAETAHNIGLQAARLGLTPREARPDPPILGTTVWGRHFSNPIGARRCSASSCMLQSHAMLHVTETTIISVYVILSPTVLRRACRSALHMHRSHAFSELMFCAGLAAGFDKDAEAVEGLLGMGFGFVEIGGCWRLSWLTAASSCRAHMSPGLQTVVLRAHRLCDAPAAARKRQAQGLPVAGAGVCFRGPLVDH